MDLNGFTRYRSYFYRVSASYSPAGEWRCTIDIREQRSDGVVEALVSHKNVPGSFPSEDLARVAASAYARVIIDEEKFSEA
ncbi:conserved hypothetical protein [Paraburkholderia piptadeniae]|uniref:Uncharacterized protein n=1 Tax=Paraburkholderia piptadeniae TaxID=1701573 RepID=A0A1N7RU16_9BURK|nr:hypothetical protein [Paraburkholderia piptadeniae]SIT38592.1 conserved hypothetical protein [Paraburkholderia piptadeniae]